MILMFATLITLACCGDVRRKAPMNFICLSIFTLAEGFMLGCATSIYNKEEVRSTTKTENYWLILVVLMVIDFC